jgi:hypothetical protein
MNECDQDVFKSGKGICVLDACMVRAEEWVQAVAKESGQKVDWHYSGGRANVLFIGDYDKVLAAVEKLKPLLAETPPLKDGESCSCRSTLIDSKSPKTHHRPCTLMRVYPRDSHGLYRAGDELPPGTIGVV